MHIKLLVGIVAIYAALFARKVFVHSQISSSDDICLENDIDMDLAGTWKMYVEQLQRSEGDYTLSTGGKCIIYPKWEVFIGEWATLVVSRKMPSLGEHIVSLVWQGGIDSYDVSVKPSVPPFAYRTVADPSLSYLRVDKSIYSPITLVEYPLRWHGRILNYTYVKLENWAHGDIRYGYMIRL
jgi:hypothetical protein